ncbi:barstar family protein [Streptomyces sp. NBC_01426]|uniref:barstar family protein n=1 Tax=Streptomyces sp. NBC_01426 TaxID=2975866 RepID=UPI002E37667D|nr:barstar family protein [Streptomyces sp. NBC_01426]
MNNPWHERWNRRRDVPLRYVLVEERDHGEDGRDAPYSFGYAVLAKCAEVEGLFAELPPPTAPREQLTLFSCAPSGRLRAAVAGADRGRVGDLRIGVTLRGLPVDGWTHGLSDAVVVAHRPGSEDPSRIDITVEATVRTPDLSFGRPPDELRRQFGFELSGAEGEDPYGSCAAAPRLFATRKAPEQAVLRLLGVDPDAPLLAGGDRSTPTDILAVDRTGRVMTGRDAHLRVIGAKPSAFGSGLLDVEVAGRVEDKPLPALEAVWALWREGRPAEPHQWTRFPDELLAEWLWLTEKDAGPDRKGGRHHLDGRLVTGWYALHCALGEAVNGPGGYYGRCWNSLFDCLSGGYGAVPPFTLVWHHFPAARRALAGAGPAADVSYAEEVVDRLRAFGVTVELR